MDRMTKATLWVAFLVLGTYFVWASLDCAMGDTCYPRCPSTHGTMLPQGYVCAYLEGPKGDQ